jgi:hypothetical protein
MNYSRRQLYALGEPIGESATRLKLGGRIYGGGGGGGGAAPSDKTTQVSELPEWARPYAKDTLAKGAALTDINQNPYQTYGANRIAGFSPMQQRSMQAAGNMQPSQQLGTATDLASAAGIGALGANYQGGKFSAGAGFDPGKFSGGTFGQAEATAYMNPYQQSVTDIGKREAARQSGIQGTQQQAQAVQAGAFGGSRDAIMRAERERNLGQQMSDIQAQGSNAAFQQAQAQFNADQARRMQGEQFGEQSRQYGAGLRMQDQQLGEQSRQYGAGLGMQGLQTALQGAGQLGQLGGQQFQQGMDINKLQNLYGGQSQQQAQRYLDQDYQDFQNQQNYPYKQLGFMSDMIRGLPLGQQSTSSMYSQGPGAVQTLAGLGGAAYGFGKSGLFAEGGEVKTYAGDRGSVTSQDNKDSIVEGMYSMEGLQKAKQAALARRDVDTADAIDERIAELNAIQAQSASMDRGLGSAFDQIPEEQQETMMAANGGIVAFAGGGTYGTRFENSLETLKGLVDKAPAPQTPEQYEQGVTARQPMLEKMYGEDITKPYLEETKSKRAGLADQMEKDKGLAFAMASLGLLSRKKTPGESQKQQLLSGLGEAGQSFIGEVGKLKKENREADDKLRQSEITLAAAQQARKEGMVNKAMSLEDKAEAQKQDAFKTKLGVQKDVAQLEGGLAQTEMSGKTQKEIAGMNAAVQRETMNKPGELERIMADVEAIRSGKKSFAGKTGEEGAQAYQDTLAKVGEARGGYRYLGPDKSPEQTAAIRKQALDDDRVKDAGLAILAAGSDPAKKQAARDNYNRILREVEQGIVSQADAARANKRPDAGVPGKSVADVGRTPDPEAVNILKSAPSTRNRKYFDDVYGAGAAARVLGN